MNNDWGLVSQFFFLSILLCVALIVKTKFHLFRKHLVPLALIAGILGLILGPEVLKIIPFDNHALTSFVYHSMSIGFIAIALKDRDTKKKKNKDALKTGLLIVNAYVIQGILGLGLSLFLAAFFFPSLFPASGMILPLGFGQGAAQAFSIGQSWENTMGFVNGGNFGLTIAAIGMLWAIIGGVPYMNYLVKKYKGQSMKQIREQNKDFANLESLDPDNAEKTSDVPHGFHIDEMAMQLVMIGIVYAITYVFMSVLNTLLAPLGSLGATLAGTIWGFSFIWATLFALALRALLDLLFKKNVVKVKYVDNFLMQKISSSIFEFMIVASIAAISFTQLKDNWIPILIITTAGGILTMLYTTYACKRVYKEHWVEYMVMNYGVWTGIVSNGMALLREVDPKAETPVPENFVLGSGIAAIIGVPLLFVVALPAFAVKYNNPIWYAITFVALIVYFAVLTLCLVHIRKGEKKRGE